jgi:hypothetical protein
MRHLIGFAVLSALATAGAAVAETWWWDFEFNDPNDLPPNGDGWLRRYQPVPFGVVQDGTLTYSYQDPSTYDFFELSRPGALDPGPNEIFVAEWRLWTEWVSYHLGDPAVCVESDDAWAINFSFAPTQIYSFCENLFIPLDEGWHTYRLLSLSMRDYDLYIDGALARQGSFVHLYLTSRVGWGDSWEGVASTHHWDYFRVGVLPAPLADDTNCDGTVDFHDINPFVQALTDGGGYEQAYPGCWAENADINGDGNIDFADINPFVDLLTGSQASAFSFQPSAVQQSRLWVD